MIIYALIGCLQWSGDCTVAAGPFNSLDECQQYARQVLHQEFVDGRIEIAGITYQCYRHIDPWEPVK